jgi:prepilin-type N-terminal cleavage/methylation domain-containing protein
MNKAFTLIELLAVIILLGVLSLIVTVTVNGTIKENKQNACEIQIENIKSGAESWASKNVFSLPSEEGSSIVKTLKELKDEGFVDKDIKNPKTNQLFSDDIKITITRIDNNYEYEIEVEC